MRAAAQCVILLLATLSTSAHAADPASPSSRPSEDSDLAKIENQIPYLREYHSPSLTKALSSPETLVKFITSPETAYADRKAAAFQGGRDVPLSQMAMILEERDELRAQERNTGWGLLPDLRNSVPQPPPSIAGPAVITVLGNAWQLPADRSPYPSTWEQQAKAPWPWQAEVALDDLFNWMTPRFGDGEGEYQRWLDAAMAMPCNTAAEASRFVEATTNVPHVSTLAVMSRWRRIAGDPKLREAAAEMANRIGEKVRLWKDDRAQGLVQLVILALLTQPAGRDRIVQNLWGESMRQQEQWEQRDGQEVTKKLPVPPTTALAICKLALDPATGDAATRLNCYAFSACSMVDDSPFNSLDELDAASPEILPKLKQFEDWFARSRPALEKASKAEQPFLDRLRKKSDDDAASFERRSK